MRETYINLFPEQFSEKEKLFLKSGVFSAYLFRFESGVLGLRLSNDVGELVLLPFQGQQIWSAEFEGRNLTMQSMFDQPHPTRAYLETYGGFLLHCGATAMGVPTKDDSHPLHGELPNAPYQKAFIILGEDDKGQYLGLSGKYQHTVAFSTHYIAQPVVKLYAKSTIFSVTMGINNIKNTAFDPEVVFFIDYIADESGWAYTMQVHPDGTADYIGHRPAQLDKGVRWICRTPDQDALGMLLPATAEPEGYSVEKAKGNIKILPAKSTFNIDLEMGTLSAKEAMQIEEKINHIIK